MGFFDLFKSKPKGKADGPPRPKPTTKVDLKKRFDLQARSGQGSMSKVWRAYDRKLGRGVCLKLLDKAKTAKFEARFIGRKKPPAFPDCPTGPITIIPALLLEQLRAYRIHISEAGTGTASRSLLSALLAVVCKEAGLPAATLQQEIAPTTRAPLYGTSTTPSTTGVPSGTGGPVR